jgi:FkbM family methyltransferase
MNYNTVQTWFSHDGDNTHRVNYDLNENSIVFDLGGYHGEWSNKIYQKYNCFIHIFEPIPQLYENICNKFKGNEKIKVYNFGMSDIDKSLNITLSNDGSSFYIDGSNQVECKVKSITEFIKENDFQKIDLIKINIEGDEFPVMNSLLDNNMITKFNDIQVQFHDFYPNSVELRKEIHNKISKTHELTYNYEFVWENWKKK